MIKPDKNLVEPGHRDQAFFISENLLYIGLAWEQQICVMQNVIVRGHVYNNRYQPYKVS